jgi:hypothetical protein
MCREHDVVSQQRQAVSQLHRAIADGGQIVLQLQPAVSAERWIALGLHRIIRNRR